MARPATAAVRLLTGEREPVRLATTANINVDTGGLLTIDGVVTAVGDRVLVKDQTDGSENGIRTASEGQWYRAADARTNRTMQKGTTVAVQEGTVNAGKIFTFNTLDPVIGDDSLSITEWLPVIYALSQIGAAVGGDLIYGSGAGAWARLAKGRALQGLRQNAGATAPEWGDFMPGFDVTGLTGASETARIAALYTLAPTQPYSYRSDSHIGIIRDTAPLNYAGTTAALVVQQRDAAAGTLNSQVPSVMFQMRSTGNGVVNSATELSQSIWWGVAGSMLKTGDGSAHSFTAIAELGAYGVGTYNEIGGFCGTLTNNGSLHGLMSGVEMLLQDSPDSGVTDYNTIMNGIVSRIARWNGGAQPSRNFFASSEGDKSVDMVLGVNSAGLHSWVSGVNLVGGTFTSGQAFVMPNNTAVAARNAAGNANLSLLFLDGSDNTWLEAGGTAKSIKFANSSLAVQFNVLSTASAVNNIEVSGATAGNAPLYWVTGSDTNIGASFATKGTGVHSFYTNGASFAKQVEIGHIASSVNYLQFVGAVTTGAPLVSALGSDTNIGLGHATKGTGVHSFFTNSTVKQFEIGHVASAVNYVQAVGAITTAAPLLSALGTDTNIGFGFATKGTGVLSFFTNSTVKQVEISHLASAANWVTLVGGIAGAPAFVAISAAGASTDIDLSLSGKGAGLVTFPVGKIAATATAGTNGAPPAQVSGYMTMKLSGNVAIRVPYYNA